METETVVKVAVLVGLSVLMGIAFVLFLRLANSFQDFASGYPSDESM